VRHRFRLTRCPGAVLDPAPWAGKFSSHRLDNSGLLMDGLAGTKIGGPDLSTLKPDADCLRHSEDSNLFAAHGGFNRRGFKLQQFGLSGTRSSPTGTRYY